MPRLPDLTARLRLDTRDLDKAKGQVAGFGKSLEGVASGSGRFASLSQLATTRLQDFAGKSTVASKGLGALEKSGVTAGSAMSSAVAGGALAAGAAITAFVADGVKQLVSLSGEVRNFQRASGASAEDASRFVAVLDDLQISSEAGATALFKLGREVSNGAPKLRQFGIEVARNKDGTANLTETLLNVADAYERAPGQAAKTGIAFAAFGKQAQALLPLLEKGRIGLADFFKGAEEHGQILSQKDQDQVRELELAIDDLQDAMRGLQFIGAKALVPFLTDLSTAGARTLGFLEDLNQKTGGFLKDVASNSVKSLNPLGSILGLIGAKSDDAKESTDALAGSAKGAAGGLDREAGAADRVADSLGEQTVETKEAAEATRAALKAMDAFSAALGRVQSASQSLLGSQLSVADAVDANRDATAETAGKEKALAAAVQAHGRNSSQAKAAAEELEDSRRREVQTIDTLAKAQGDLAVTEATANGQALSDADQKTLAYTRYRDAIIKAKDEATDPAIKANLIAHINDLKPPEIVAKVALDTVKAEARADALKQKLATIGDPDGPGPLPPPSLARPKADPDGPGPLAPPLISRPVKLDTAEAERKAASLRDAIARIYPTDGKPFVVKLDTKAARDALNALIAQAGRLETFLNQKVTVAPDGTTRVTRHPIRAFHLGGLMEDRPRTPGLRPREIPAILEAGEYVIRRAAVDRLGVATLDRLNRFHSGGQVRRAAGKLQEDQVPYASPSGAKLVKFDGGKATYADGRVYTSAGWAPVRGRNAGGLRFNPNALLDPSQVIDARRRPNLTTPLPRPPRRFHAGGLVGATTLSAGASVPRFHSGGFVAGADVRVPELMARIPDLVLQALRPAQARPGSTTTNTTIHHHNNNVVANAVGANADVARFIDAELARAANRAY